MISDKDKLFALSVHYRFKKRITDDYGNAVMMFFNEDFLSEIIPLMSKFRYSKLSRTKEKPKYSINHIYFKLREDIEDCLSNHKFNVVEFVSFGQNRGRNWHQVNYDSWIKEYPEKKKKKKFLRRKIKF